MGCLDLAVGVPLTGIEVAAVRCTVAAVADRREVVALVPVAVGKKETPRLVQDRLLGVETGSIVYSCQGEGPFEGRAHQASMA